MAGRKQQGLAAVVIVLAVAALAAGAAPAPKPRAKPPKWDPKDTARVFSPNAFEKLVGDPPKPTEQGAGDAPAATPGVTSPGETPAGGTFAWSKLISADDLEDEVKSLQSTLSKATQTPEPFKGGGYKESRRALSELAVLFGVIAEYDANVRWKKEAAGLRDGLARAGFNCKVGTDASFKEAKLRREDLEGLIRGGGSASGAGDANKSEAAKWDKVAGRPPLMQRIETAQQQAIAPWTASTTEFGKNAEKLSHEAQILAMLAEVIQRDGYEFADDPTYRQYAKQLEQGALEVVEAVKVKNYAQARAASAEISKACSNCHDGYRSN